MQLVAFLDTLALKSQHYGESSKIFLIAREIIHVVKSGSRRSVQAVTPTPSNLPETADGARSCTPLSVINPSHLLVYKLECGTVHMVLDA